MAPQKRDKNETLDLNSIEPEIIQPINYNPRFFKDAPFGIREIAKQRRITSFHYVIHALAFMIVIPFLFMVFFQMNIPPEYSTIVSIVVGFYFGKAILEKD